MPRLRCSLPAFAVWGLLFITSSTAAAPHSPDTLAGRIDALFAAWDRPDTPGAVVAVVQHGEIVYARGYGMANLEHAAPLTPSTVFLAASVSKQFTAFAIALLADQGKLSLDDDVRRYVPELPAYEHPITIRHLIHHTSGLRDEFELLALAGYRMDDVITKETILRLAFRQQALNFKPGDEYLYANTGYTLLAEIVERVTGQSFRSWTTAHLFEPLGMNDSHFRDDYQAVLKNRAQGYYQDGDRQDGDRQDGEPTYKNQVVNYANVGASGLYTTAEDLARWVQNFEDGRVGGRAVLKQVHEQGRLNNGDTLSYAFGLGIGQYKGHARVSHSGSHRGFRTYVARFPDDDLAVIVLSNLDSFQPTGLALQVADLYLVDPPERLAPYAGAYHSGELGTTYHLDVVDGRLVARHRRYDDIPLTPSDVDVFSSDTWFFSTLTFIRDGGRITGFRVTNSRARNIEFAKR